MTEQLHFHFSLSCIGEGNGNPFQYSCLGNPRDRYVIHLDGELDIYITDSSGMVVYEGHNPEIGSFLVNITEDDRYTMTVEGNRAKGSISFQILRNEE